MPIRRPKETAYGLIFGGDQPSDLVCIVMGAPLAQPGVPATAGGKGLAKSGRVQTRSHCRPSSGAGGLCRSLELGSIGYDHAISKEVGSKMAKGAGAAGRQSRGRSMPEVRWLTAPSSISGIMASVLGRLRTCECARAYA